MLRPVTLLILVVTCRAITDDQFKLLSDSVLQLRTDLKVSHISMWQHLRAGTCMIYIYMYVMSVYIVQ